MYLAKVKSILNATEFSFTPWIISRKNFCMSGAESTAPGIRSLRTFLRTGIDSVLFPCDSRGPCLSANSRTPRITSCMRASVSAHATAPASLCICVCAHVCRSPFLSLSLFSCSIPFSLSLCSAAFIVTGTCARETGRPTLWMPLFAKGRSIPFPFLHLRPLLSSPLCSLHLLVTFPYRLIRSGESVVLDTQPE